MASDSSQAVLAGRRASFNPNASVKIDDACIVRGVGCYLYDEHGHEWLDCINNVAHVGHCHPKVTDAVCDQLRTINTNSRFLNSGLADCTKELLATLPQQLETVWLVNSGSEANDLALRIAHAARPGATHVAVMAGAYHGHVDSLIPLSSYKFWGAGGNGRQPHVHVIPCPDTYRGKHLDGRAAARGALACAAAAGGSLCALFVESVLSCGGQVVPPAGYLQALFGEMHAYGVVCVSDEVQSGFGRVGSGMWGFQAQGAVPDIVTMGKAMGNGYPVAAIVATKDLATKFCHGGMEYFNTYGGANGACAAALSVLRVVREEGRMEHAATTGGYLMELLAGIQPEFPFLGDVRGTGLMVGVEVVDLAQPESKVEAPVLAGWIIRQMRSRRVLLSTDGPYDNVIKVKPPMVFGRAEAERLVCELREVLTHELTPEVMAGLKLREAVHARDVVGPRRRVYDANEAEFLGTLATAEAQQAQQAQQAHQQAQQASSGVSYLEAVPVSAASASHPPQLTSRL